MVTFKDQRVSLRQASKILGISYGTVRKYARLGYINSIKIGTRHTVSLKEIERFQAYGNRTSPEEQARLQAEEQPGAIERIPQGDEATSNIAKVSQRSHATESPPIDEDLATSDRIPSFLRELNEEIENEE